MLANLTEWFRRMQWIHYINYWNIRENVKIVRRILQKFLQQWRIKLKYDYLRFNIFGNKRLSIVDASVRATDPGELIKPIRWIRYLNRCHQKCFLPPDVHSVRKFDEIRLRLYGGLNWKFQGTSSALDLRGRRNDAAWSTLSLWKKRFFNKCHHCKLFSVRQLFKICRLLKH